MSRPHSKRGDWTPIPPTSLTCLQANILTFAFIFSLRANLGVAGLYPGTGNHGTQLAPLRIWIALACERASNNSELPCESPRRAEHCLSAKRRPQSRMDSRIDSPALTSGRVPPPPTPWCREEMDGETARDIDPPSSRSSSASPPPPPLEPPVQESCEQIRSSKAKGKRKEKNADLWDNTLGAWKPTMILENSGSVARDHLASERTFLAYVRTSLTIASTGVGASAQLFSLVPSINY